MSLKASELILNKDGSIYHLNLLPHQLADTIITVGDPERVPQITKYFEKVEFTRQKREFKIQTGLYKGKRITVMSTGMGTDNIDIAFTEIDALANIDFEKKTVKDELKSLDIIRIGTTGSIQENIPINSFLVSEMAMGFDGLLHFYKNELENADFIKAFIKATQWNQKKAEPYLIEGNAELIEKMNSEEIIKGITATNIGFYGPQGRVLRIPIPDEKMNDKMTTFEHKGKKITNLEMETSGIYGLSKLLGHRAVSMNAVLANRVTGEFSEDPLGLVDRLIQYTLKRLVS